MSYGYRLNVEQILLKSANENWSKAKEKLVNVSDSVPESGEEISFLAPDIDDEETIVYCIQSVLGWAIAVESFVNLVWLNYSKTSNINEREIKSTVNKIKYIFKGSDFKYGEQLWRDDIVDLFNLRDYLVHYKDKITYIGFSFAPKYQKDFSIKNMERYELSVTKVIDALGEISDIETSFLSGDYELFYYDE